jgi:hypothetical protein
MVLGLVVSQLLAFFFKQNRSSRAQPKTAADIDFASDLALVVEANPSGRQC